MPDKLADPPGPFDKAAADEKPFTAPATLLGGAMPFSRFLSPWRLVWLAGATVGAATTGCAPETTVLLEADSARAGALGDDGPLGALLSTRTIRVRGDRPLSVDIITGSDDDVTSHADGSPVLLVQGGNAAVARYHWLAAHLASRGATVVMPHYLADLAFFSTTDGSDSLVALRQLASRPDDALFGTVSDDPALAVGHSLGGVVAAGTFEADPDVGALALLSSYPDPAATLSRTDGTVVSIVGADDGLVSLEQVQTGVEAFQTTAVGAVVEGLTHYQLTDDPSDAELEREGTVGGDIDVGRARAAFLIDAILPGGIGADVGVIATPAVWPAGLVSLEAAIAAAESGVTP